MIKQVQDQSMHSEDVAEAILEIAKVFSKYETIITASDAGADDFIAELQSLKEHREKIEAEDDAPAFDERRD